MRIIHLRKSNPLLSIIFFSLLFAVLLISPYKSGASQSIYTIQVGSFLDEAEARKQYEYVLHLLRGQETECLRIEKVGRFYTVRMGRFESYADTEKPYHTVKPLLSEALVMKAYMIDDRIVKLHECCSSACTGEAEKDVPQTAEISDAFIDEKADTREQSLPVHETVVSISDLVKEGEYNAALYIAKNALEDYPENPELNAWTGTVLLKKDLPLEALKYLKKAAALSPDVADYHNGLGYSWFFLGKYDEALKEFERAVRLEPGHVDALSGLCMAYAETGNKEKAMELYNKIKFLDEDTSGKLLKVINPPL